MKTITFEFIEIEPSTYHNRDTYPHPGFFFWKENKASEGSSSPWTGIAFVEEETVWSCLLETYEGGCTKNLMEFIKESSSDKEKEIRDAPRLMEAPPTIVPRINIYGEQCTHSFNDVLRALAAAAGTLPEEVSHDRRI